MQTSELAASMVRQVCADHAKDVLSKLDETLSEAAVNKGILRRLVKRVLTDPRLTPWLEELDLAIIERYIPTKLHLRPYWDSHNASRKTRHGTPTEKPPFSLAMAISDLSITDSDLFLDPMEFLFEEYEGELVSQDDIKNHTLPLSWDRTDALLFPHSAVLDLLSWEKLDDKTLLTKWQNEFHPLFYAFHTYSPYFDDPAYGALSLSWLLLLSFQLRFNKSLNINTGSIFLVPVHVGPQQVGSFCFTSERRTTFADRVGLARLASEMTNAYLDAETELLEQRRQLAAVSLPTSLLFTHESRHTLAALDASLHTLKDRLIGDAGSTPLLDVLQTAAAHHAHLTDQINAFESELRHPKDAATLLSTRHLAIALSKLFFQAGYKDIAIVGQASKTVFWLKGAVSDLFDRIEPLVRNGIAAAQKQYPELTDVDLSMLFRPTLEAHDYDFWIDPHELNESTKVLIGISILFCLRERAHLVLRIKDVGGGFSEDLFSAIQNASAFSRLPSDRFDGGRGIISVISAINSFYKTHCEYSKKETAWVFTLRVRLEGPPDPIDNERGG